jgi:hypothetical protein
VDVDVAAARWALERKLLPPPAMSLDQAIREASCERGPPVGMRAMTAPREAVAAPMQSVPKFIKDDEVELLELLSQPEELLLPLQVEPKT